jgi:hypothetical protein
VPGQLRTARDLLGRVAAHEREIQRPPRQPQQRHPEQLPFQEEAQQRNASVEHLLQHQDIHPALVIGQHQIVAVHLQHRVLLHVDAGAGEAVHHPAVHPDPAFRQPGEQRIARPPHAVERQQRLQQRHQQQGKHMQHGVGCDQQGKQYQAQWEHGNTRVSDECLLSRGNRGRVTLAARPTAIRPALRGFPP